MNILKSMQENKEKKLQLFMLPFAGGNAFSFMKVGRFINKYIEVIPIDYAGHGSRESEPFIEDYNIFINDIVHEIRKYRKTELPYALFGFSLGSAIALELCSTNFLDLPATHCFICAEGGLVHNNPAKEIMKLDKADFEKKIIEMGEIDDRVKTDPNVYNKILNIIWRDFIILGQFRYNGHKISCNSTVLYSPNDITCTNMHEWADICLGNTEYIEIGRNHLFIHDDYEKIAIIINEVLQKTLNNLEHNFRT